MLAVNDRRARDVDGRGTAFLDAQRQSGAPLEDCFLYYGVAVAGIGLLGFGVRFSEEAEASARQEYETNSGVAVIDTAGVPA